MSNEDAARDARLRQEAAELTAAAAALMEKIRPALKPAGCIAAPGCDRCPYAAGAQQ